MIITEQKKLDKILEMIGDAKSVFVVGCGLCATSSKTGGENEVKDLAAKLEAVGKQVLGSTVVDSTCDTRLCKKSFKQFETEIENSDALVVMSCGAGVQTVAGIIEKPVYPALDSLFLAKVERAGKYYEMCTNCGDCQLDITAGICVFTRCPKNTMNGPCGGSMNGKCEVNQENDCAWVLIENRLKSLPVAKTQNFASPQCEPISLSKYNPPRDLSRSIRPHKVEK